MFSSVSAIMQNVYGQQTSTMLIGIIAHVQISQTSFPMLSTIEDAPNVVLVHSFFILSCSWLLLIHLDVL